MAAILRPRRVFKPEVVPEIESYIKIGHAVPYMLSFVRRSNSNIKRVMAISKCDLLIDLVT